MLESDKAKMYRWNRSQKQTGSIFLLLSLSFLDTQSVKQLAGSGFNSLFSFCSVLFSETHDNFVLPLMAHCFLIKVLIWHFISYQKFLLKGKLKGSQIRETWLSRIHSPYISPDMLEHIDSQQLLIAFLTKN